MMLKSELLCIARTFSKFTKILPLPMPEEDYFWKGSGETNLLPRMVVIKLYRCTNLSSEFINP